MSKRDNDDAALAAKAAAVLGVIFAGAAFGLYGGRAAFSVIIGAGIAVLNLVTMRAIIRALIQGPAESEGKDGKSVEGEDAPEETPDHAATGRRGGLAWGIFAVLKILILFGGIYVLLTRKLVDPMALVVGYGVLPLGIAVGALWSSLAPRR